MAQISELRLTVQQAISSTPVIDIHTHLFPPEFGEMNLHGIDSVLTYHYLIAETFRVASTTPAAFWSMTKTHQADLIWQKLFVENSPVSEAARGVVSILSAFGLDPAAETLDDARDYFRSQTVADHINKVFDLAGVESVVMTNDPFDPEEMRLWENAPFDPRFHASLRMDRILNAWPEGVSLMTAKGYTVNQDLDSETVHEIRRYVDACIERMNPLYMAVSLPDDFQFPADDVRNRIIKEVILPTARDHQLPFAVMIGVRRGVNPALRGAGDGVGRADVGSLERLCLENPDVKFLATFLSLENQHELCVAARKFSNLMPFGCWWFLNNPSIITEMTTQRLELLGTSFIPQHSDARVLEQLIYKWKHSRRVISDCLADSYVQLDEAGRRASADEIERDVKKLFSATFRGWVGEHRLNAS